MANIPAFQASDESSILSARTKIRIVSRDTIFILAWTEKSNAHQASKAS